MIAMTARRLDKAPSNAAAICPPLKANNQYYASGQIGVIEAQGHVLGAHEQASRAGSGWRQGPVQPDDHQR
jgi:hypothetical protein